MEQQNTRAAESAACVACGKAAAFDPVSGKLVCPFCGAEREIPKAPPAGLSIASEADLIKALPAPTGVCPFRVSLAEANKAFDAWISKKVLSPAALRRLTKDGAFTPVYLPAWTFGVETVAKYRGDYGVDRPEKDRYGRLRNVTDWYPVSGTFIEEYPDRLGWGTDAFDGALLEGLTPFRTEDCRAYRGEYLAGYAAIQTNVNADAAWKKVHGELETTLLHDIRSRIIDDKGAHHLKALSFDTAFSEITLQYLLLPAYTASFTAGGKTFRFLINGETGKVSGKAPKSALRCIAAALVAAAALVGFYLWAKGI